MLEVRLRPRLRWIRRKARQLWAGESGAHTLEYVLLIAAIVLPGYIFIRLLLATLLGHYNLVTTVNSLPFP